MLKRNYFYIFLAYVVLTFAYLSSEYIITDHQFGVPLDDSYIHYRFAENLSHGYFFHYNIGEPTPGTTSPLWVVILTVPFLFSKSAILIYSIAVSSIFFLLTCFQVYKLSKRIGFNENYAMLAVFLTLISGRLLWASLSGMEVTLFSFITLVIVNSFIGELEKKKISYSTGILLGISALVRPEAYLFALIYFITVIILFKNDLRTNYRNILFSFVFFILIISPYPIFCYINTGGLLPNTFQGQKGGLRYIPDIIFLREAGKIFFKDNVFILLLMFTSIGYFLFTLVKSRPEKKLLLLNLWIVLLPACLTFLLPKNNHHGRYLIPLLPFINILSVYILVKGIEFCKKRKPGILACRNAFVIALFLLSFAGVVHYGYYIAMNVDNINDQHLNVARWVEKNLPEEKIIALNDIGAISYITDKRIIDMEGLVTPDILKIRKTEPANQSKNFIKYLKDNDVNYLIIYPSWYKSLMQDYSYAFDTVYSARVENGTILGDIEMFVFKINWEKINLQKTRF
ncbi:MAG: hypothetical protein EHM58_01180 [Ignavibacteriae bacterium]|nr:MAG: hypothetical protein EHM58_01180 [Ignavibacteriota bacterium]